MARKSFLILSVVLSLFLWLEACGNHHLNPQPSCNFVENTDQQRVSWKGILPIHLFVHESVPPEAYQAIKSAIAVYNNDPKFHKKFFQIDGWGINSNPTPQQDGESVIYWMKSWESDRSEEQARTTIHWIGPVIQEADIRIDAANFQFSFDGTPASNELDLESIMVHELGHVLGLAHVLNSKSVMQPSLLDGVERRKLGMTDEASLKCEY